MATAVEVVDTRPSIGNLNVLDKSGDVRVQWDRSNPEEIAKAQATFKQYRAEGYLAYKVNKKGDAGEVITDFDTTAERIILAPQMKGG
jgi:hypothetical protein